MHVIATAGHVDHGKSTLVKALTGTDPDRLDEEHRRGLSIQLGYCWTTWPEVGEVAFVDVPGHERFLPTMLAGVGPVPAVLLVVAADDPWMPQAAEHLAALDGLGVRHGVVAVTRSDLADPGRAGERVRRELARTSLRAAPVVPVSGTTGTGLETLRAHLEAMARSLPTPDPEADVRIWLDRVFTVRGAGTVVTGTLPAGTVRPGDTLVHGAQLVRVRGVEALGRPETCVTGVARVALNLTGATDGLDRGSVLVSPHAWHVTEVADVRLTSPPQAPADRPRGAAETRPPREPMLHIGAAAVTAHLRPLAGDLARLTVARSLPLRVGDRALLRDPGSRRLWGVTVLDPAPPPLGRRGAAADRARVLRTHDGTPDAGAEITRRGVAPLDLLRRIGVPVTARDDVGVAAGGWLMSQDRAAHTRRRMERLVGEHDRENPLQPGVPLPEVAQQLGLPAVEVAAALVRPPLRVRDGRVTAGRAPSTLPADLERALAAVEAALVDRPYAPPPVDRLRELGLDRAAVAVAARAGRLLPVADGVVLLPGADRSAAELLAGLPQPFTVSEARIALGSSRRVVIPLLALLDRRGLTRRLPDDRRSVTDR